MDAKDRIIVALDYEDIRQALNMVALLGRSVGGYKVGPQLIGGYGPECVRQVHTAIGGDRLCKVFYDDKTLNTPDVVAGTVRMIIRLKVAMLNIHCLGGPKMMQQAADAARDEACQEEVFRPLILGVTILTSLDFDDLFRLGFDLTGWRTIRELVVGLAKLAQDAGLDGVICSPQEISAVREACGPDFKIVTPGIRSASDSLGDQKRVDTALAAIQSGADKLVIGRPITQAADPCAAVEKFTLEIVCGLNEKETEIRSR